MNVEEAREAVMRQLSRAIPARAKGGDRSYYLCEKAADVYGAARELKGHVDACRERHYRDVAGPAAGWCGGDWLCEKAKETEERS